MEKTTVIRDSLKAKASGRSMLAATLLHHTVRLHPTKKFTMKEDTRTSRRKF